MTDADKAALRQKAKAELKRLETYENMVETTELLNRFKNKYNICETVYKIILAAYRQQKEIKNKNRLLVNMRQVPSAMAFAGYALDKELLQEIFGAKSSRGKTIKKLRDSVTHGINSKSVQEIQAREKELFTYMDIFLSVIRNEETVF